MPNHVLPTAPVRSARPLWVVVIAAAALLSTPAAASDASSDTGSPPLPLVQVRAGLSARTSPPPTHASYRAIRSDDPGGRLPLLNPHRGLRLELFFNAADLRHHSQPKNPQNVQDTVDAVESYIEDTNGPDVVSKTNVTQVYFYLHDYIGTDVSPTALANMQHVFDELQKLGYTVVLRFAYAWKHESPLHYTVADIQRHLGNLQPLLHRNAELITSWEAGFLGAWGEWGPSVTNLHEDPVQVDALMTSIVATAPPGVPIIMRYPWHREMIVDPEIRAKIGYHNDFFGPGHFFDQYHPNRTNPDYPGDWYLWVRQISPHVMVDGEMPYQLNTPLNGITAARRLQSMHYTTLSEVHERTQFAEWQALSVTEQVLIARGLPVDEGYFRTAQGTTVDRSAYEYIRDHLGYRLRLEEATFAEQPGSRLQVELSIVNDGFSAPHIPRTAHLVLLDVNNRIVDSRKLQADWTQWQGLGSAEGPVAPRTKPRHGIQGTLNLAELDAGTYRLGLWLPAEGALRNDSRYAVRLANADVVWSDGAGVNVIADVELTRF